MLISLDDGSTIDMVPRSRLESAEYELAQAELILHSVQESALRLLKESDIAHSAPEKDLASILQLLGEATEKTQLVIDKWLRKAPQMK